jgi:hypothetical protein
MTIDASRLGRDLCPVCMGPVSVPFGGRNYCRPCADECRAFLESRKDRHPSFGQPAPVGL